MLPNNPISRTTDFFENQAHRLSAAQCIRKRYLAAWIWSAFLFAAGFVTSFATAAEKGLPAILESGLEKSPGQVTYYVDPKAGNDTRSGTSAEQAWKSLDRVSDVVFAPGDKILLKAGTVHRGALCPRGSGAKGKPIVVDRYGKGSAPMLDAGGWVTDTIRLHNQSHWTIRNLIVCNDTGNWSNGDRRLLRAIHITAEDVGDLPSVHLENLTIRRVNGQYRGRGHDTNGGIICVVTGNKKPTRFVDLRIESCTFETQSIDRYADAQAKFTESADIYAIVLGQNSDKATRARESASIMEEALAGTN